MAPGGSAGDRQISRFRLAAMMAVFEMAKGWEVLPMRLSSRRPACVVLTKPRYVRRHCEAVSALTLCRPAWQN